MTAIETEDTPFHLKGNFAPVDDEVEAIDLAVEGAIPPELEGRYLRNGSNPRKGSSGHWFLGDGMIHGIRLRNGRAEWYRNKWVRTPSYFGADRMGNMMETGTIDRTLSYANTHVVCHAGRIFALEEGAFPYELTADLETAGTWDYNGRLATSMTAHPKECPETGELHFFGYGFMAPFLTYHRATADGELVQSEVIDVKGPTMIHDFAISRDHVVFMDLPVIFDLEMAMSGGGLPYRWDESYGARVGLLPRREGMGGGEVKWFDVDPCYVFHTMNAFDDRETGDVVVDSGRHAYMWRKDDDDFAPSVLHRWRFDLAAGTVKEEQLDDRAHVFPRVDDRKVGLANRWGWAVLAEGEGVLGESSSIAKYDMATGAAELHPCGSGRSSAEPVFVPATDASGEDEGYVMSYVYDAARDASDFVILDATDMNAKPVAVVPLPQRVPHGFHGSWIPDSRL